MGIIDQFVAWITSDPQYRHLLTHVLNHLVLIPPLVTGCFITRRAVHWLNPAVGFIEILEIKVIKAISLVLVAAAGVVGIIIFVQTVLSGWELVGLCPPKSAGLPRGS